VFCRAVGEGDAEGKSGRHAGGNDGGEAIRHETSLSSSCGGQYEQRAMEMVEDGGLLMVGIGHAIDGKVGFLGTKGKVKGKMGQTNGYQTECSCSSMLC
jgi:hypothetical protein